MMQTQELLERRNLIEQLRYGISLSARQATQLGQSILSSWQRCAQAAIPNDRLTAPMQHNVSTNALHQVLQRCQGELAHIAQQSSMVVAVADVGSSIIWSAARGAMQRAAEQVNFMQGGQWREECVGTNALALSLKTQQASCVFANEHHMQSIQDWVCYAAPIVDPYSKQILGVIDLSTTWQHHNALGLLAAERCAQLVEQALLEQQRQQLYLHTFGSYQASLNGKSLNLTPRQMEILCILALCPQGLTLDRLHQHLYGERQVSLGTLKAEMSQLRDLLGGMLGSRPYRLLTEVVADFLQAEHALDVGYCDAALKLCTGVFLAKTESPLLLAWRDCLESRLSYAIYQAKESDMLFKHLSRCPEAVDAVERLIEMMPKRHPMQDTLFKLRERQ